MGGVPVNSCKVNRQPCTWMPLQPLGGKWISGENQLTPSSRSSLLGHLSSGLASCNNVCRNSYRSNLIWPGFLLRSFLFTEVGTSHHFLLGIFFLCWKQNKNWWPFAFERAWKIFAVNLAHEAWPLALFLSDIFPVYMSIYVFTLQKCKEGRFFWEASGYQALLLYVSY